MRQCRVTLWTTSIVLFTLLFLGQALLPAQAQALFTISPALLSITITPGTIKSVTYVLTNASASVHTFSLSTTMPQEFKAILPITALVVAPYSTQSFDILIVAGTNLTPGTHPPGTVTASPQDLSGFAANAFLTPFVLGATFTPTSSIVPTLAGTPTSLTACRRVMQTANNVAQQSVVRQAIFSMTPQFVLLSLNPGTQVLATFYITNNSTSSHTIMLSAVLPEPFQALFPSTAILVQPNSTQSFAVLITAPSTLPPGIYSSGTITATDQNQTAVQANSAIQLMILGATFTPTASTTTIPTATRILTQQQGCIYLPIARR